MKRAKPVARIIEYDRWPDSAAEDLSYWLKRPPEERIRFGRALLVSAYRRVHGRPLPRTAKLGRVFEPGK